MDVKAMKSIPAAKEAASDKKFSQALTSKTQLKEELRLAARSVNVSQLDELGEYITKLALELRFSKSEDGNLDGLHPLVAEEQGKLYAERTRLEDMNGSIGSTTDTNKRSKEEVRRKSVFITEVESLRNGKRRNSSIHASTRNSFIQGKDDFKLLCKKAEEKNESGMGSEQLEAKKSELRKILYRKIADTRQISAHEFCGLDCVNTSPLPNNVTVKSVIEKILENRSQEDSEFKIKWHRELLQDHQHKKLVTFFFWYFFMDINHVALSTEEDTDVEAYLSALSNARLNDPNLTGETEDEKKDRELELADRRLKRLNEAMRNKDALFDRMAVTYMNVFMKIMRWKDKDEFFWRYPDFIAQSVFVALCESFTSSVEHFNVIFKMKLNDIIGELFLGVKSFALQWRYWNLDKVLLTSARLALNAKKGDDVVLLDVKKKTAVEEIVESLDKIDRDRFKVMNKETRALAVAAVAVNSNGFLMARKDGGPQLDSNESLDLFDPKGQESAFMGPGPKRHRVKFDIYGNSILIRRCLNLAYQDRYHARSLHIHRNEIERDMNDIMPDPTLKTYRAFLHETGRESEKRARHFKRDHSELSRDRHRLAAELNLEMKLIDKVEGKVMSRPTEIREICDQICDYHLKASQENDAGFMRLKRFQAIPLDKFKEEAYGTNQRSQDDDTTSVISN